MGIDKYGASQLARYEQAFEPPVIVPCWHGGAPQIQPCWHPWHLCDGFTVGFLCSLYINEEELRSCSSKGNEGAKVCLWWADPLFLSIYDSSLTWRPYPCWERWCVRWPGSNNNLGLIIEHMSSVWHESSVCCHRWSCLYSLMQTFCRTTEAVLMSNCLSLTDQGHMMIIHSSALVLKWSGLRDSYTIVVLSQELIITL